MRCEGDIGKSTGTSSVISVAPLAPNSEETSLGVGMVPGTGPEGARVSCAR